MALLLDSCRVYQEFSYTEWPTPADFSSVNSARVGLLAVYGGMKWRMKPTLHFATNEALLFAAQDGTVYHTLNEGPENMHKEVKQMATNTMKNIQEAQTGENHFQQVINHQSQQRALRKRGKAPLTYQLNPANFTPPTSSTNITPPKYLPM